MRWWVRDKKMEEKWWDFGETGERKWAGEEQYVSGDWTEWLVCAGWRGSNGRSVSGGLWLMRSQTKPPACLPWTPPHHRDTPLSERERRRGCSLGDFRFNDFGGLYWLLMFNSIKPTVSFDMQSYKQHDKLCWKTCTQSTTWFLASIKRPFSIIL